MPVTIHTCPCACLTVVWRCLSILGFSSAGATRLDLTIDCQKFSSKLDMILHPQKFSTMNNLQYTVIPKLCIVMQEAV